MATAVAVSGQVTTASPDVKAFRRTCHEASQRTGGDLTEFASATSRRQPFRQAIIGYQTSGEGQFN